MQIKRWVILSIVVTGGLFLFLNFVWAQNSDVVINEIGAYEPDNHEWVEIFNRGLNSIDLTDWKFIVEGESAHGINLSSSSNSFILSAGEYGIIAENADNFKTDYPMCTAKIYDTANFTLNENGSKKIGLRDNGGIDLEFFNYPEVPNYSLERINSSVLAIETSNWQENPSGNTVGVVNYWTTYVLPTSADTSTINQLPMAVINGPTFTEIGTSVEFDSSDSYDPNGTIVDCQWIIDNILISSSSVFNYQFATSGTSTVGLVVIDNQGGVASTSLIIVVEDSLTTTTTTSSTITTNIFINEFLSDPNTGEMEWVELYNANTSSVDLTGWSLLDSVAIRNSPTGTIPAQGFCIIEFNNILNNTGDTVILKNPLNNVADQVVYGTTNLAAPEKGNSLARRTEGVGSFAETTSPTKGAINIINVPVVSNTNNSSGGQTYANNTISQVNSSSLKVIINELLPNPSGIDNQAEYIELKNVGQTAVNLKDWQLQDTSGSKYKLKEFILPIDGLIVFKRSETNIALNNSGTEEVLLFAPDNKLVDSVKYEGAVAEGVSYGKLVDGSWVWTTKPTPGLANIFVAKNLAPIIAISVPTSGEVEETLLFDASDTIDPENNPLSFIWNFGDETGPIEGVRVSHEFTKPGKYKGSLIVEDGFANQTEKKFSLKISDSNNEAEVIGVVKTKNSTSKINQTTKALVRTSLENLLTSAEVGDRVVVRGRVGVLPGVFGLQYFYLIADSPSTTLGIQVYLNNKDFPDFKIGELLEVRGEVSLVRGEWRIKIKTRDDIKPLGFSSALVPTLTEIGSIDDNFMGGLVKIQGEITEAKSSYLYVDDGTGEIQVYFKKNTGINRQGFKIGEQLAVTGLIIKNQAGWQLLPRSLTDIENIDQNGQLITKNESLPVANKTEAADYLTFTAGGLTSILLGLLAKARGRLAWGLIKKSGSLVFKIVRRGPPKV